MSDAAPFAAKRGFDLTFNLGHAIILCGIAAGLIGSHYLSGWRLDTLERQNATIEAKLDRFTAVVIDAAVTAQRIKELERRLDVAEKR